MTLEEMGKLFKENEEDYLHFERVKSNMSSRADLHAMILLDKLCPPTSTDIIIDARDEKVWLAINIQDLALIATPELIIQLIRCGILYDNQNRLLYFLV